jgi:hypothetical protein
MNEAERCDRISLMHRGRVLAVGTPAELVQRQQAASLEESFIRFLEQDEARESGQPESVETVAADKGQKQPENTETGTASNLSGSLKPSDGGRQPENAAEDVSGCLNGSQNADQKQPENLARAVEAVAEQRQPETPKPNTANNLSGSLKSAKGSKQPEKPRPRGLRYWLAMVLTFALREGRELAGDRIRLMFALLGPLIYLFAGSLGISYDTDQLDFAVLDQDQSRYSRELVREFEGSAYFRRAADLSRREDIAAELTATRVELVIEIPPHFGRDLLAQRRPQVAFYIDGAMPQQGENIAGYAQGIAAGYALSLYRTYGIQPAGADLDMRFIYNPTFKSINALAPGFLMLALVMIPAMMTALGVVREKEIGSIMNLYSSPASSLQYLLGKQLPYVALSMGAYVMLVAVIVLVLDVPVKGSLAALTAGALCFVLATTAFGLLVSAFVRSQVAAIFAAAILAMIPAMNFSGMIYPFSTLSGSGYWIGRGFPASWFQMVGLGVITKGLLWRDVYPIFGVLLAFFLGYLLLAALLLKKQES